MDGYKYLIQRYGSDPEAVYDTKEAAQKTIEQKFEPDKWDTVRVRDRTAE